MNQHTKISPHRPSTLPVVHGNLIIETDSIFRLSAEVSQENQLRPSGNGKVRRLWDLMPRKLARLGFNNYITEIAAYKAGKVYRDGKSAFAYLPETPYLVAPIRAEFLGKSFGAGDIHILPTPERDRSPEAQQLQARYRIHISDMNETEKRAALAGLPEIRTAPYLAVAAREAVESLDPRGAPIFFLSDNARIIPNIALTANKHHVPVYVLTMKDFITSIYEADLFPHMNIGANDAETIIEMIADFAFEHGNRPHFSDKQRRYPNNENTGTFTTALKQAAAHHKSPAPALIRSAAHL